MLYVASFSIKVASFVNKTLIVLMSIMNEMYCNKSRVLG